MEVRNKSKLYKIWLSVVPRLVDIGCHELCYRKR